MYRRERWRGSRPGWIEEPSVLQDLKDQNRPAMFFLMGLVCLSSVGLLAWGLSRGTLYLAESIALIPGLLVFVWATKFLIDAGIPIAVRADGTGVAVAYPYSVVSAAWSEFDPRVKGPFLRDPARVTFRFLSPPGGGLQLYGALTWEVLRASKQIIDWEFAQGFALETATGF